MGQSIYFSKKCDICLTNIQVNTQIFESLTRIFRYDKISMDIYIENKEVNQK